MVALVGADPRGGPWASVIKRDADFAAGYARHDPRQYIATCERMRDTLFDRDTAPGASPEALMRVATVDLRQAQAAALTRTFGGEACASCSANCALRRSVMSRVILAKPITAPFSSVMRSMMALAQRLRLAPAGDREDDVPRRAPSRPVPVDREDLPYKVEIWNETGASVEQIVAVTANAGIGYAAWHTDIGIRRAAQIHAAQKEHPEARILLRRGTGTVPDSAD